LSDKSKHDLVDALEDLLDATQYQTLDIESRKAVSNSLVRAQCVKLANALMTAGAQSHVLSDWIEQSKSDPLPEVRFSLEGYSDFEL